MAKYKYPTRGETFGDWNTPLSSEPIKGDVVPPNMNPGFPMKDGDKPYLRPENKQPINGVKGARKSTVKQ